MKKKYFLLLGVCFVLALTLGACQNKKAASPVTEEQADDETPDSTVYGVCGEGTSMHSLQLITDVGDTLEYAVYDDGDQPSDVQGGLMAGDHVAVIGTVVDGERVAQKVINVTTLLGKWTSIDKNFEIEEGGVVKSNIKAETSPWTSWKIFNGKLVLNKDTFEVDHLGADSLYLENDKGIFSFKRQI